MAQALLISFRTCCLGHAVFKPAQRGKGRGGYWHLVSRSQSTAAAAAAAAWAVQVRSRPAAAAALHTPLHTRQRKRLRACATCCRFYNMLSMRLSASTSMQQQCIVPGSAVALPHTSARSTCSPAVQQLFTCAGLQCSEALEGEETDKHLGTRWRRGACSSWAAPGCSLGNRSRPPGGRSRSPPCLADHSPPAAAATGAPVRDRRRRWRRPRRRPRCCQTRSRRSARSADPPVLPPAEKYRQVFLNFHVPTVKMPQASTGKQDRRLSLFLDSRNFNVHRWSSHK